MTRSILNSVAVLLGVGIVLVGCSKDSNTPLGPDKVLNEDASLTAAPAAPLLADVESNGFVHGIVVDVDGVDYYLAGAPDGPDGAFDIPGHTWLQLNHRLLLGKHYNTGPFGTPKWWSSDAPNGAFLYKVRGVIDTWSLAKAKRYAKKGFVHYHELITVADGTPHPTKVLWLRHIAVRSFTLDGGPHPELAHAVTPGIDYDFIPNGMNPYTP